MALGAADDEALIRMVWGADAIQTGHAGVGAAMFTGGFPSEAAGQEMDPRWTMFRWELETIVNEALATPKGPYRTLRTDRWNALVELVQLLRRIDELDYAVRGSPVDVFAELYRIGGRQFDWQRGYLNAPQYYRSAFIYGQGECAEYFKERHGVSVAEMSLIGFVVFAGFLLAPELGEEADLSLLDAAPGLRGRVLGMISARIADVRGMAARERALWKTLAYRPSVLRRFPCIRFGHGGRRVRSPLPALILERTTSGLFYDLVGAPGRIRNDCSSRFEEYAARCVETMLPGGSVAREARYRVGKRPFDTPDVLVSSEPGGAARIVTKSAHVRPRRRSASVAVSSSMKPSMQRSVPAANGPLRTGS